MLTDAALLDEATPTWIINFQYRHDLRDNIRDIFFFFWHRDRRLTILVLKCLSSRSLLRVLREIFCRRPMATTSWLPEMPRPWWSALNALHLAIIFLAKNKPSWIQYDNWLWGEWTYFVPSKCCRRWSDSEGRPCPMRELHSADEVFLHQGRDNDAPWPAFTCFESSILSSRLPWDLTSLHSMRVCAQRECLATRPFQSGRRKH